MISTVRVVGTGRAGGAIAARLAERGLPVATGREPLADADLVLLAVPDAAIAAVAQQVPIGPWLAHVSGATSLAALDPHTGRRLGWLKPAAAVAVAAGTAFAAVLLMRPGDPPGGVATVAQVDEGSSVIADFAADDSASPTPAQSQRLAGYLVAHSQFATPIGRRNVWTSVLAQDPGIARVAYETAEGL